MKCNDIIYFPDLRSGCCVRRCGGGSLCRTGPRVWPTWCERYPRETRRSPWSWSPWSPGSSPPTPSPSPCSSPGRWESPARSRPHRDQRSHILGTPASWDPPAEYQVSPFGISESNDSNMQISHTSSRPLFRLRLSFLFDVLSFPCIDMTFFLSPK